LAETVDSVLLQTWTDLEIVVVDDGSTDGTPEVVEPYGNRIRYFQKKNEGPSSARNFGATKASGEALAFIDSDDIWEPNKLDVQMGFLDSHSEIKLVSCRGYVLGSKGKARSSGRKDLSGDLFLELYQRSFINTSSVVLARDCFFQAGTFDESIRTAEDYDLWLRVARQFPIAYLDIPLVGIRKHADELRKNKVELRRNAFRVIKAHFDPDRVPDRVYRKRLADLHIYLGRGYLKNGDVNEARAAFRHSMRLMPLQSRSIRYYVGTFLTKRRDVRT
jgi:glycosyltransferase involved in cell wall biosynthesis